MPSQQRHGFSGRKHWVLLLQPPLFRLIRLENIKINDAQHTTARTGTFENADCQHTPNYTAHTTQKWMKGNIISRAPHFREYRTLPGARRKKIRSANISMMTKFVIMIICAFPAVVMATDSSIMSRIEHEDEEVNKMVAQIKGKLTQTGVSCFHV